MRHILIIEDDEYKAAAIKTLIALRIKDTAAEVVMSVQQGLKRLMIEPPDLVLLDMSIPTYDPGPGEPSGAKHFGGEDLLGHMDRFDIEIPVILVTQFDNFGIAPNIKTLAEVDESLRATFPAQYRGYVYYHATITAWQEQLLGLIDECLDV